MPLAVVQLTELSQNTSVLSPLVEYLKQIKYSLDNMRRYLEIEESPDEILSNSGKISFCYSDTLAERDEILSVMIRLFWLSCGVGESIFIAAVPELYRSLLLKNGLVSIDQENKLVKGEVCIVEFELNYFFSDTLFFNHGDGNITDTDASDFAKTGSYLTMPIHASSIQLYRHRRPQPSFKSLLDVGCGCGVQSICSETHYTRRVGIDLEERSVLFSKINSKINNRPVEFLTADCLKFRPSERFESILFNAPGIFELQALNNSGVEDSKFTKEYYKYDLGPRFIHEQLELLLEKNGLCQIWCLLYIPKAIPSVDALLEAAIPNLRKRFNTSYVKVANSTMSIAPDEIRTSNISKSSPLAFPSYEHLVETIKRFDIYEIAEVVIDVSLKAN